MDVLVLGPEGADIEAASRSLGRAGHDVHRCAVPAGEGQGTSTCVGAHDHGACPLNGAVDVALLVGDGARSDGIAPIGLGCAIRDLVPLTSLPLGGDAAAACTAALHTRDEQWTDQLRAALGRDDVRLTSSRHDQTLHVRVRADVADDDVAAIGRLATRAYDIVRDELPSGFRSVDVAIEALPA